MLLDSGANIECKPVHLAVQYAIMGNVYSRDILGYKRPRVGLLNVGTEDGKGNELTLEAFKLCKQIDINFIGNVEGYDLFANRVDVVICDGFVGNVVLKTCESLAMGMISMLKRELGRNPKRQLGAYLAQNALRAIKRRMGSGGARWGAVAGIEWHGDEGPRVGPRTSDHECDTNHDRNRGKPASDQPAHHRRTSAKRRMERPRRWRPVAGTDAAHESFTPARNSRSPRANFDFKGRTCSIAGVGSYVPERILTNADLEKMVETTDEWITSRTGIKQRRVAAADEYTSDLATRAALRAMKKAGVKPEEIDLIIVATITPDMPFPSTACLVQHKIGAHRAAAFDLEAACSGFIYGLEIAQQFIMSRTYDTVLVIGAEKLSSIVDWKDRNTCVLFGDGAGAAVLQNRADRTGC